MKTYRILLTCILLFSFGVLVAQEEETEKKKSKPVRNPWESTLLIESQTAMTADKGQFEMLIHHRFGAMNNGFSDFLGIYAASNIRMGLQWGITDRFTLGFGTEKNQKMQDIYGKYAIMQQNRDNSRPIAITAYAVLGIDARNKDMFGAGYEFTHRLSYFTQVIFARKFTKEFSLQLAPSYTHFNSVDRANRPDEVVEAKFQHDKIGLMVGGRYKVTKKMGIMVEYNQPFGINPLHEPYQLKSEAGFAFGLEIGTSTHAFQIFATNSSNILSQNNYAMNLNKFNGEGIRLGFNITVRF